MAAVAMAHGVNANLLRRCVREAEIKPMGGPVSATIAREVRAPEHKCVFVPVRLPAPTAPVALPDIRVELQRGATAVTVTWPASAATECATWMREVLR
jgi:transposase-like protein